ncbi:MAG: serine hydrolase, partial [Parvibaculaceae bacterium]|nr:serine hydrolase [Parvibaculaceae bacterium]
MTENKIYSRRGLKAFHIILPVLAILGYFIFRLFEPVFVWNNGWQVLSDQDRTLGEQTTVPAGYADVIAAANIKLDQAITANNFPAVSIALGKDGELVWSRAAGYRDLDNKVPATLDTKFRIGSVSKAVSATIAAKLFDEGVLDIDAPIEELVPYYPQKNFDITTRQLMSHTAGIRHYGPCLCFPFDEYSNQKHHKTVEGSVGVFSKSPLLFEPGTDFSYSSYGFVLA